MSIYDKDEISEELKERNRGFIDKIWNELLVYCKDDYDKERWKDLLIDVYNTFNGKEDYDVVERKNYIIDGELIKESIIRHMENVEKHFQKRGYKRDELIPDLDIHDVLIKGEKNKGKVGVMTRFQFWEQHVLLECENKIGWGWIHYYIEI